MNISKKKHKTHIIFKRNRSNQKIHFFLIKFIYIRKKL